MTLKKDGFVSIDKSNEGYVSCSFANRNTSLGIDHSKLFWLCSSIARHSPDTPPTDQRTVVALLLKEVNTANDTFTVLLCGIELTFDTVAFLTQANPHLLIDYFENKK